MKHAQGSIDPAVLAAAYENYTQCQRSDGTIYGTSGSCKQKGAKEVSPKKGGEGGGELSNRTTGGMLEPAGMGDKAAQKGYTQGLDQLGTHALRDRMTKVVGKVQGKSATEVGIPMEKDRRGMQFALTEAYDRINRIRKGEGKEPMSITSIIDKIDLDRIGIDADKATSLAKQGKSSKGAIKKK